jgi:hypothetical protein
MAIPPVENGNSTQVNIARIEAVYDPSIAWFLWEISARSA